RASLEEKMTISEKKLQGEIDKRKAEWDQNVQYAQNNKLTPDEEAAIQQRLEELSSEIEAIRQKEGEALRKKEEELQNELQKKVREFLDRYAKEKGIDYVINYQQGLNILLFTNSAYDVTNEVVKRLNVEYGHEKTSKSK
ncbi:MAG: OmpH family outer membrane protein, partial [Crocinitomicaceae bacterium]|nr:OmpH family outer membrane protein [Crocinitomicaceae bacterium]